MSATADNNRIQVFTQAGKISGAIYPVSAAPGGIVIDRNDILYVTDLPNPRTRMNMAINPGWKSAAFASAA